MLICQAAFVASSWGTAITGGGEAALKGISTHMECQGAFFAYIAQGLHSATRQAPFDVDG